MKKFFSILLLLSCSLSYAAERQQLSLGYNSDEPVFFLGDPTPQVPQKEYTEEERDHISVVNNINTLFNKKYEVMKGKLTDAEHAYLEALYNLLKEVDLAHNLTMFPGQPLFAILNPTSKNLLDSGLIMPEQCNEVMDGAFAANLMYQADALQKIAKEGRGLNGIMQYVFDILLEEDRQEESE